MFREESKTKFDAKTCWTIYLLLYLPLCLLPAVKYSVSYLVAGLFTMLPLFIVALTNARYRNILVALVGLGIIQGTLVALLDNAPITEIINEPIRSVRYFVPCVLLDKVFDFGKKGKRIIWIFTTALIVFVILQTLYALETNPMVSRILALGSLEDEELMMYRFQNVGGFGNCYALCITFAMWVYLMFRSSKGMKFVSAAVVIFIFYFTVRVQYMTMLLLCVVALLLVVLSCLKNPYTKILGVVFVIVAVFCLSSILRWIATLGVDSIMYVKLNEFANTLDGANTLSDTTSRVGLYKEALATFLSNPICGATNDANAHSTILATAANSGIIGLFAYFYGIKQMYSVTKGNLQKQNIDARIFNITFVGFIILAMVNPVHYVYEISTVLLFYIPLTLNLFANKSKKSIETTDIMLESDNNLETILKRKSIN